MSNKSFFPLSLVKLLYLLLFLLYLSLFVSCSKSNQTPEDSPNSRLKSNRTIQTEYFCQELKNISLNNVKTAEDYDLLIENIESLLNKYPKADPKLRITLSELTEWLYKVRHQPNLWERVLLGLTTGIKSAKSYWGFALGVFNSWQEQSDIDKKAIELKNGYRTLRIKLEELSEYLKDKYDIDFN